MSVALYNERSDIDRLFELIDAGIAFRQGR
jgi:selenocysteine lyase/cysteine desulfurase